MATLCRFWILTTSLLLASCTQDGAPGSAPRIDVGGAEESAYPQRPLWGDTHVHTSNSFDAFGAGNRLGPEQALRFAMGEEVLSSTGVKAKLARPLDFLVIADHSNNLGVISDLYNTPSEKIVDPQLRRWRDMMHEGTAGGGAAIREIITAIAKGTLPEAVSNAAGQGARTQRIWSDHVATVERFNQPGRFTAFIGFEYSLANKGNTLHRNVIFRDGADKALQTVPYPSDNKEGPERLWTWMENYEAKTGGRLLAIPHNSNTSNGMMFPITETLGGPMKAETAKRRLAREPLVETTQIKGDSESHVLLSPDDAFADFGDAGWENGNAQVTALKKPEMLGGDYVREALKRGLLLEAQTGVNPYKLGLIGSTDAHTSLSTADENNFFGKLTVNEPGQDSLNQEINPGNPSGR